MDLVYKRRFPRSEDLQIQYSTDIRILPGILIKIFWKKLWKKDVKTLPSKH